MPPPLRLLLIEDSARDAALPVPVLRHDGIEVLQRVRISDRTLHLPVVAPTAPNEQRQLIGAL